MNLIPHVLSGLRICLAPLVFLATRGGQLEFAAMLVIIAIITDCVDGWLARKLNRASSSGSYLDVFADFIFLFAAVGALVLHQVYSVWLLAIMIAMFLQFVLQRQQGRLNYDPIGKHFGSVLYGLVFLSLMVPDFALARALFLAVLVMTAASIFSRSLWVLTPLNH